MAPYTYQPLDLDGLPIRLLRLIKGNAEDVIQCEIFEAWIGEDDGGFPYEALSYTWGSKEKEASITVNGSTFPVTTNLFAALKHLRFENEDRILWIDAICIDQECEQERNHQVRYMGDIYTKARQVVIWLGEGTEDTDLTMDTMKRLQENTVQVMGNWRKSALLWMHTHGGMGDIRAQQKALQQGMRSLLARPWFQRVWILQEVANARVAIIICGSRNVSARIFAQVPALIELMPDSHCQAILDIMPGLSRRESWWGQDRQLLTLLRKFRESRATDGRDIVFALLGISSDTDGVLLPDYTKSLQQVIDEATSFLLFDKGQNHLPYLSLDWTLSEFLQNLDSLGNAVLGSVCRSGDDEIWILILESGEVDINSIDKMGRTPLSWAAQRGNEAVATLLLDQGAKVNSKDNYSQTPLQYAIDNRHSNVAELLIAHGAVTDPNPHKVPPFDEENETSVLRSDYGNLFDNLDTAALEKHVKSLDSNVTALGDNLVNSTPFHYRSGDPSERLFGGFQGEPAILESIRVPLDVPSSEVASRLRWAAVQFENFSSLALGDNDEYLQYKACASDYAKDSKGVGIVYSFPKFADESRNPVTLEILIESGMPIPPLGQRFNIAQALSVAMHRLHNSSYLHKFIRPQNILFFTPKGINIGQRGPLGPDLDRPVIAGMKLLPTIIDRSPDLVVKEYGELLCQHPQQRRQTRGTTYLFRPEYDIYAFGCLLFNLAMWGPVSNPLFSWAPLEEVAKARREILDARVGSVYVDAMFWCLGLVAGSPILFPPQGRSSQDELNSLTDDFYQNVVLKLYKCSA